jgi:type I restriction enzyme R subunit
VIDYQEEYKYDLLNQFKVKDKYPQIAVSVDMLDTGIDVPEVTNLVFFKPVRSSSKYWQMIGRGTRLCTDLFGKGFDKRDFVIFDFCENFEFFDANPKGYEATGTKSISHRLFELRLRLAYLLLHQEEEGLIEYGNSLIDHLISQTQSLNGGSFIVRQHWEVVEKYRDPNAWNSLNDLDIKEIFDHIAPLVVETDQDEMAKRFDVMMLDLQLSIQRGEKRQMGLIERLKLTAQKLSKKASIPSVAQKMETIKGIQQKQFLESVNLPSIEKIRIELRDLIKFLDFDQTPIYYTDFEDIIDGEVREHDIVISSDQLETYRNRVKQYLLEKSTHLTINKLRTNLPITKGDLEELERMLFEQGSIGTKEDFEKAYGIQPLGKFIRKILGMESNAAKLAFGEFLNNQTLTAKQIHFLNTIINHLTVNGSIEPAMLFEPPFTEIDDKGIGIFDDATSTKIISLIEEINHNSDVA